jgi:hypothetical protein
MKNIKTFAELNESKKYTTEDVKRAIEKEDVILVAHVVFTGDPRTKHAKYGDAPVELVPRSIDGEAFMGDNKDGDQFQAKIKDIIEIK